MSVVRVHQLAKELGVANKVVLEKAKALGIEGKVSHSSSLTDEETEALRRHFIREALGAAPDREQLRTQVDGATGEQRTVLESRKGNVIRRRKASDDDASTPAVSVVTPPQPVAQEVAATEVADIEESAVESVEENGAISLEADSVEAAEEVVAEAAVDPIEVEDAQAAPADVVAAQPVAPAKPEVGPRILGRIELDIPKPKPAFNAGMSRNKPKEGLRALASKPVPGMFVEDGDDEGGKKSGGKKVKKFVEFSRGDLVDYSGRYAKKGGKGGKGGRRGEDDNASSDNKADASAQKAVRRVIKMSGDVIMVGDLAHQMSLKAGEVISKLISLGVMATINQAIDVETATIVADEFGYTVEFTGFDELDILKIEGIDDESKMVPRPPVVTVMGHVDHGKTSLLDYIRKTSVTAREHGGITQHIGAYMVETASHRKVTFLDTPGHAAFTAMRARGAQITDIVILVVAADDGVMPQTIEAINHAKSANVAIVVAVNKMDKPSANPDRVKQQLAEHGLQPEDWGGDTIFVPVSAKTGQGIDTLLESMLLVAEIKELKANPECRVKGTVIEVRQEVGRGTVATVLVQAGTLNVGDLFVAGAEWGKIRSMNDHTGAKVDKAGPSTPVEITGLSGTPAAGDDFVVVSNENQAKQVATTRSQLRKAKEQMASASGPVSLEEFARQATEAKVSDLNVIIKADVHGSLEAVKESLSKLATDEVRVKIVHGSVGGINESDVQLALASKAIILGFGVRGEPRALAEAESTGIEIRFYRIIYELIDDIKAALSGLLKPIVKEKNLGRVEVRQTFSAPKVGTIAGCYVLDGTVKRGGRIRLLRDSRVVHEGRMSSLKRFKDDVKEVQSGYECGLSIDGYNDVKVGDVIEVFEIEEVARTL